MLCRKRFLAGRDSSTGQCQKAAISLLSVLVVLILHGNPYYADVAVLSVILLLGLKKHPKLQPCVEAVQAEPSAEIKEETALATPVAQEVADVCTVKLKEYCKKVEETSLKLANLGNGLRQSAKGIREKSSDTKEQSEKVAGASGEVDTALTTLADGAAHLFTTVQGMTEVVRKTAQSSQDASKRAEDAKVSLTELSKTATVIDGIVSLITTIAGQTNLLALNATIEAARAGEAGRGFAVVASEVKTLSKQTAEATDKIRKATQSINSGIEKVSAEIIATSQLIDVVSDRNGELSRDIELQRSMAENIDSQVKLAAGEIRSVNEGIQGVKNSMAVNFDTLNEMTTAIDEVAQEVKMLRRITTQYQ